ncbi:MAG: arginyltransferase [Gemmataceae bacterium]|nr:arginyltransferase [Gemmataceae bacterium]
METLYSYVAPPSPCHYLPGERWSLQYEMVQGITAAEYMQRLVDGWRRFGGMLFRPRCPACTQCRSLRVDVARFRPNRSQRRAAKLCAGRIELRIGAPGVSRAKLRLYDRFHQFQAEFKGWPDHPCKDVGSYGESFVRNPAFTEEWCYYKDGVLAGVGYVDALPAGLSAIYFFYDPVHRPLSLGTWNVLSCLDEAKRRGLPHVYLGYFVAGCPSLEYKANFKPNQIRYPDGHWRDFLVE